MPESTGPARDLFVERLPPGPYAALCDAGVGKRRPCPAATSIRTDAIGFGTREASIAVAWWTGSAFRTIWTGD